MGDEMRDPNHVPTVAEALSDPAGFVAGMTEAKAEHRQLPGGMVWTKDAHIHIESWSADRGNVYFQIMKTKQGKFRLIAFDHEPSTQFPDAEFWMREYDTMHLAMHQAECM